MVSRDEKVSRINVPAGLISGEPQDGNRGTGFPTLGEPRDVPPCPAVKPRDEDTMVCSVFRCFDNPESFYDLSWMDSVHFLPPERSFDIIIDVALGHTQ